MMRSSSQSMGISMPRRFLMAHGPVESSTMPPAGALPAGPANWLRGMHVVMETAVTVVVVMYVVDCGCVKNDENEKKLKKRRARSSGVSRLPSAKRGAAAPGYSAFARILGCSSH